MHGPVLDHEHTATAGRGWRGRGGVSPYKSHVREPPIALASAVNVARPTSPTSPSSLSHTFCAVLSDSPARRLSSRSEIRSSAQWATIREAIGFW